MEYRYIKYERGKVARVILNRPQYNNALSFAMMDEIDRAFRRGVSDEEVKVIVLSGEGDQFCSGHDLGTPEHKAEHEQQKDLGYSVLAQSWRPDTFLRWRNLTKPTIAMVHGYCIFAGYGLAASMDVIFASNDALFLPQLLFYPPMPWDFGPRKAKELMFEHRFMTASEARERGLVNRVYKRDKLEKETLAYAERVADNYYEALAAKRVFNNMLDLMGFTSHMYAGYFVQVSSGRYLADRRELIEQRNLSRADVALRNLKLSFGETEVDQ